MSLLLSNATEKKMAIVKNNLPHALLLTGEPGVGLATIAKSIAEDNLATFIEPLTKKGDIDHDTGTISIEVIRGLYEQTRTRSNQKRIIIIDDAERMSIGAQAAFLKLLEEPTDATHFILTSHTPRTLLPTIRSRVQTVIIEPVSSEQTATLINSLGVMDNKTKLQLNYLADGLPAEITRLVQDSDYFKHRAEVMGDTRTLLTGTTYEKLLVVNRYYQSRAETLQLLSSALAVTKRSLSDKPQENLARQLDRLLNAKEKIEANRSARLQLMALVVQ